MVKCREQAGEMFKTNLKEIKYLSLFLDALGLKSFLMMNLLKLTLKSVEFIR